MRYEYDIFGAIRAETGTSDNTRKFTGKEFDADSNLYYYAARYYDPYIGRFTQRDPIADGVNWYAYTANNPLKYTDTTGMWLETFVDVVGLGLSIYDFIKDPSLGNAAWVALDAGAVLAPFVPGTKTGRIAFKWVTKSDPAIEFKNVKSFRVDNARSNLIKATKVSEKVQKAHEAHHLIPKSKRIQAELDRVGVTINVHQPALLTWWKKETHSTNWKKYENEWMDFFSQHTHLTNDDVLLQAQTMAERWKGHFYNEEYY